MKKIGVLLCLVALATSAFAFNRNANAQDVIDQYGQRVNVNVEATLQQVLHTLADVENALDLGYVIKPGDEEHNQYGTMIRERLEKDYQLLFEEDARLASYVFDTIIRPVSADISGMTLDGVVAASGQAATQADKEALANVFDHMKLVKIYVNQYHNNLTGPEELNQGATKARENLEEAYQTLFNQNPELASYVFTQYIQPISPNISGPVL